MDDWVKVHLDEDGTGPAGGQIGPITMGHYDRSDLPFYYSLADAFTLCDGYFCSVIGPTDPNRIMWFSATVDPEGKQGGPVLDTLVADRLEPGKRVGTLKWKTMPEVLQEAGVSWKVYSDATSDALLNPLPYFKAYNKPGTPFFDAAYGAPRNNTVLGQQPLTGTFELDVAANRLPQVSWLFPAFDACEHPSAPPSLGEAFISSVLETLVNKPEVWEKTALFVMYDENGGFFDHVAPPTAPKGTPGEYVTVDPLPDSADGIAGPIGLGFRVPMLVLSPYSRGGLICSDTFDHTSQLKFLERRFGTPVPNLSAWRRETVGDMVSAFNFAARPTVSSAGLPTAVRPSTEDLEAIGTQCLIDGPTGVEDKGFATPVPKDATSVPDQESGHGRGAGRPSGLDHCETPSHRHPRPPVHEHRRPSPQHAAPHGNGHPDRARPAGTVNRGRATGTLARTGADAGVPLGAAALTGLAALVYRLRARRSSEPPR
jgi:phospholipase C